MFGLFKNGMNLSQMPAQINSMTQSHINSMPQQQRPGWDMFSDRRREAPAPYAPPQGMFQQPGGWGANANPGLNLGNGAGGDPNTFGGFVGSPKPFTSYHASGNGTVELGRRARL
jgi:hypothetical protein